MYPANYPQVWKRLVKSKCDIIRDEGIKSGHLEQGDVHVDYMGAGAMCDGRSSRFVLYRIKSTKQNVLCEWFWKRDHSATQDPSDYNLLENYILNV
jgi:hypothetical protein